MYITNNIAQPNFEHYHKKNNSYSTREKAIITGTTALGVATSLAVMAKCSKYSLNPKRMFKNFKNSYIAKTEFLAPQIISIGAGTCLGGLAGGYLVDHDALNRKAKRREAVMQMGNISVPILTVAGFDKVSSRYCNYAKIHEKSKTAKGIKAVSALAGIFTGVYIANYLMNKLSNVLFRNKDERGVKVVDFSAHVDDILGAAQYSSKSKFVHNIARIVPLALMFPGFEVGNKKAGDNH